MANEVTLYGDATPATVVMSAEGQVAKFDKWEVALVGTYSGISLVQAAKATKGSGLTAGTFIHTDGLSNEKSADFDAVSELWLVPIAEVRSRRLCYGTYDPKSTANNLQCYSNNTLTPSESVEEPFAKECGKYGPYGNVVATCPKAVWGNDGTTPQCKLYKDIAFVELLYGNPVTLTLHGSGLGAWNKFLSTLKRKRDMARLKKQPLSSYVIHVTSENMGQYWAYVFNIDTPPKGICTEDKIPDYYKLAAWYGENIFAPGKGAQAAGTEVASSEATSVEPSESSDTSTDDQLPF
jgi:hypothetical protein